MHFYFFLENNDKKLLKETNEAFDYSDLT